MSISHQIETLRSCGQVICGIYHGKQVIDTKSRLKACGLDKMGFGVCSKIEKQDAKVLAQNALQKHIWTEQEVLSNEKSKKACDIFFSALHGDFELYTNYMWGGIEPISHNFIDKGILAVSKQGVVGILWVVDDEQP